jgi:hypothetical protein
LRFECTPATCGGFDAGVVVFDAGVAVDAVADSPSQAFDSGRDAEAASNADSGVDASSGSDAPTGDAPSE